MADITGKILEFARASKALDKGESRECAKLAEMVKALLFQKAHKLIERNLQKPVLYHYSSDGTPMTITRSASPMQCLRGNA